MKELFCDAILFDLDGVLVDSGTLISRHWSRWALAHGVDPNRAVEAAHGRSSVETVALLAPHLDARLEADQIETEQGLDPGGMERIAGAAELVTALPADAWAVVTSGKRHTAAARLAFAGVPVPKVIVTADDVSRMKPDPEGYLKAAARLGAVPEQCVVVEDSLVGIQSAHAAGMQVVAIAKTYPAEALNEADLILARLDQLAVRINPDLSASRLVLHLKAGSD